MNWLSIVLPFIGSLMGAAVPFYVYRRQLGQMRSEKTAKQNDAIRKSIEPLYADLGTLVYSCTQQDFDKALLHIKAMVERNHRGEYDMPNAPVLLQNHCMNTIAGFYTIATAISEQIYKDIGSRGYILAIIQHFANTLQVNLDFVRAGTVDI